MKNRQNDMSIHIFLVSNYRQHGTNPTIMVDMKEFVRILSKFDDGGLVLGGRFQPVHDIFEYFFGKIKENGAQLVFFWRLDEGRFFDCKQYARNDDVFDCIRSHQSLKEHLGHTLRPCERMYYNLIQISENYGDAIFSCAWDYSSILSYGRQYRHDVLALITRDTEYLVFDNEFEYWSLSGLQISELEIVKFDRVAIYEMFGLNSMQMQLLCAISQSAPQERIRICGDVDLVRGCVPYVKRQEYGSNGYDVSELTGNFTEAQIKQISYGLNKMRKANSFIGSVDDEIRAQ